MVAPTMVSIEMRGIELLALKKLSLVSHALAGMCSSPTNSLEQRTLAQTLDDVIRRIELAAAKAA